MKVINIILGIIYSRVTKSESSASAVFPSYTIASSIAQVKNGLV